MDTKLRTEIKNLYTFESEIFLMHINKGLDKEFKTALNSIFVKNVFSPVCQKHSQFVDSRSEKRLKTEQKAN